MRESSVCFVSTNTPNHRCQRVVLFNALSASRTRSSRACCKVERDSLIRDTASLSGVMLKFPIVWWMSCLLLDFVVQRVC